MGAFRVLLIVLPVIVFLVTRKLCRDLRRGDSHPMQLPVGSRVRRTATGGYDEVDPDGQAPAVPDRDRA